MNQKNGYPLSGKTLDFEGITFPILVVKEVEWVPIELVCEALEINFKEALPFLKEDEILSENIADHFVELPDGATRKMLCIREHFMYGWLFSCKSNSTALEAYKLACFNALQDEFHLQNIFA